LGHNSEHKKEADLKELILTLQGLMRFILSKWKIVAIAIVIGAIVGGIYAKTKKTYFIGTSTFVIENGQSGGVSGLSLLGLGGGKSNSGLFDESDNIVWLYTTHKMIQKSLLSIGKRNGKEVVMIEWFMDAANMREKVKKNPALEKLKFNVNDDYSNLSVEQNALLGWCSGELLGKYLSVKKVDRTENIISVTIKSLDESFAKAFNEILVNNVNNYYVETKTQKAAREVSLLQQKLDSFRTRMNTSMVRVAEAVDNVPYANPNQSILKVSPQRKSIDVQLESAMYVEVAKNLEESKLTLAKLTPLIQVIEAPTLPLPAEAASFQSSIISGGFITAILAMVVLTILYLYRKIMA